jgi:hypothetical protein
MKFTRRVITLSCGTALFIALLCSVPNSAKVQPNDFTYLSNSVERRSDTDDQLNKISRSDNIGIKSYLFESSGTLRSSDSLSGILLTEIAQQQSDKAVSGETGTSNNSGVLVVDNGRVAVYDDDFQRADYLETSKPVFKAFALTSTHKLLYSPLSGRSPSGELLFEDLKSGEVTKLTTDLIIEAVLSPDETHIAYTFASSEGFGLKIIGVHAELPGVQLQNVVPDYIRWGDSGQDVIYFSTNEAQVSSTMPVLSKVSASTGLVQTAAGDPEPADVPKEFESTEADRTSLTSAADGEDLRYPFRVATTDHARQIIGDDFLGNSWLRICASEDCSQQQPLIQGRLIKLLRGGIVVRTYAPDHSAITFVNWDGTRRELATTPSVTYTLPLSSFVLTQGGSSYPSPGNCSISSHTGSLSFAYDMQNQTIGKHVLASADGLVVDTFNTANCNSGDPSGCSDFSSTCSANSGWGNTVIIQHADSTFSRYSHMQFGSVQVSLNATACPGQYLGNQGHTGNTAGNLNGCGDHLHFQKQSTSMGSSISAAFSDASNPLSCGSSYSSSSSETAACCSSTTTTLRNRDNGPPIHPPGSLIKTANNQTVFLIDSDNRKRPITSASVLAQLYNQSTDARTSTNFTNWVTTVAQDEMDLYEQGGNISAAQPGNGRQFPDGKLIGLGGEVSIVTGTGNRRTFATATTFNGLGFNFCQVVNLTSSEYNAYPAGPPADAMLLLTGNLNLSMSGQSVSGSFTVKNVGFQSISLSNLGIGGRFNSSTVFDIGFTSMTIAPGGTFTYNSPSRQLTNSGTYTFFVAYQETNGHWALSVPAAPGIVRSVTINVTPPPSGPTANSATNITSNSFTANWSSSSGATGYRLDVSTSNTFSTFVSGFQDLDVGNNLSRSVTGLNSSTNYFYRVRAYNSGGTSGNSNTASATTGGTAPAAPSANAATNVGSNAFTANWSTSSGASGYRLDVSTSNTFGSFVFGYQDLDVGNTLSGNVSGLSPNTTYFYRVRAYNAAGNSGNSNTANATTNGDVPAAPSVNPATNITTNSFTANWNTSSGATGYRIDVSPNSGFGTFVTGYQDLDVGNITSLNVNGLAAGTDYFYRLRAYNSSGTSGSSGTTQATTTLTAPAPPTVSPATNVTSSGFTANWSNSSGATGYRLDVSTSNTFGSFQPGYQDLDVSNVSSFTVSSLSAATNYFYRVRAYNSAGTSSNSGTATLTTSPIGVTNVAAAVNGGLASASSILNANFPASAVNNGDRKGVNWGNGGGWADATFGQFPDWVQIDFNGSKSISEVDVFTIQDNYTNPVEPTSSMTFSIYGLTGYDVQYWTGSAWVTVLGGSIVGNNKIWKQITFAPITTTKIRVLTNAALDGGYSRITEVEAWDGITVPPLVNFALSSNGGTATASSILSPNFPASGVINGERRGMNWGNGGGWADSSPGVFGDWVQIDLNAVRSISEIDVFTLQDNYTNPVEPTASMTFTLYGLTAYDVQYWNGTAWVNVAGGNIVSNNKIWRQITFAPISTNKIRVMTNAAIDNGYSRVTEVEAWGSGGGSSNVAASASGAIATASSVLNGGFIASGANNGDRKGTNWGSGGGWADATFGLFPDWVQIDFNGSQTISEVDVFTLQDNYTNPLEPTATMTFSTYGLTTYDVQYWNGTSWATVPGGGIVGNNKIWRQITFTPITTTKIRVLTSAAIDNGYSRITEVEAWTPVP